MKKILTVGVFDLFHFGHLELFKNARAYGDYLIVAVQKDDDIVRYKPNVTPLYSLEKRMEMIKALRYVDEVIAYTDVDKIIKEVEFDVFAIGADQNHDGFKSALEYCLANKKQVCELPRTKGISSTYLKTIVKTLE